MGLQLSIWLLAFAVSLDNFSTGFTYGLRKMKIPLKSLIIIALCSGTSLFISMLFGKTLLHLMRPETANRLGGAILILIGLWVIIQFFLSNDEKEDPAEKVVLNLEIHSLGVVIHILKKPTSADFDRSGIITGIEAVMLGIALSLDAFGAGIGAAMMGYSPYLLSLLVAGMSFVLVSSGIRLGKLFSHLQWIQKVSFIPGILLIFIGICKF
ncbi:putative membrane protein YtaF [Weizmannia acidilactici]|uniref:Membrane protein YtaF n=1 Tax=Weizmannia acidilactici TaxID=2607726 RepID=A0A5J4JIA3_9BACI|nr:sporulation membrane protein YtaF [Weizmannia acidilactici]GER67021.1 putative membrane protein YtaF [Weizmannia acidilactici]GER70178.1 putative membrane protein YtaF [Weizmannia acidilactici]GER73262.1 putative membrane protein YtaF [Weizmannia acidilactici]